jgi:CheY-like chemotaxis protein
MPNNAEKFPSSIPESALIVDTDGVILQLIRNHLNDIGVKRIFTCGSGQEAWKIAQTETPTLIVMDWKLQGMSGVCLYNRMRSTLALRDKPVLAISGLLGREDFRLLEEYPCTAFLAKPFSRKVFQEDLEKLQADYLWLSQHRQQIDATLRKIPRDGAEAIKQMKAVLSGSPNPVPVALIAAQKLREFEFVPESEMLLRQILRIAPHSIFAMNELGKMLHLQGKHNDALAVLEKASSFSPKNLARLCLTGEVQLNLGNPVEARESFQKALEIDPDSEQAQQGMLLATNISDYVSARAQDKAAMPHQFASLLNTIGIAKVRSGDFEGGIKQYRAAIAYVHAKDVAARLCFNLGLAYLRWKKLPESLTWFIKAYEMSDQRMIKAKKYVVALSKRLAGTKPTVVAAPIVDEVIELAPSEPQAITDDFDVPLEEEEGEDDFALEDTAV